MNTDSRNVRDVENGLHEMPGAFVLTCGLVLSETWLSMESCTRQSRKMIERKVSDEDKQNQDTEKDVSDMWSRGTDRLSVLSMPAYPKRNKVTGRTYAAG